MKVQEFHTYQEQTFDSFCTRLIRNEGINAQKELARRSKREIVFSAISFDQLMSLVHEDTYHPESITLSVGGEEVIVSDVMLGQAILALPPKIREVILLSFFLELDTTQIATALGVTYKTIRYRKAKGLKMIKDILEVWGYEA